MPALKEHKNNAHTLLLAHSYLRSQPGRPRARHGELTPRWPRVRELPLPLLLGLKVAGIAAALKVVSRHAAALHTPQVRAQDLIALDRALQGHRQPLQR